MSEFNGLPEVTEEEYSLLKRMIGVDLHEVRPVFHNPPEVRQIELVEGMIGRGLVFEFNDGHGRAWCVTHIGHDVIRAHTLAKKACP